MLGHVTIYGNLSGSNIKQIRFVSFGPDKTYNFISSPHPGIFRLFGIRESCLINIRQFTGFIQSLEICKAILQTWKKSRDIEKVWKSGKKCGGFFSKLQQALNIKFYFPVFKSHSISPVTKTFNHKVRSFRTLLCPLWTVVTVIL